MSPALNARAPLVATEAIEALAPAGAVPLDVEAGAVEGAFVDAAAERTGGIDIEWHNITCFVSESKEPEDQSRCTRVLGKAKTALGITSAGKPTKQIMCGASGFARRGEILAVMGPSGSGKTTLLNVLAQRPTLGDVGYWEGNLLINGGEIWNNWEREMAYVMQKDIFYDELQVRENLLTTALLRLPYSWSRTQKVSRLAAMITSLGLGDVADTKIGSAVERGLSGGEVKRTSIANECLGMPRLFFLDEPLTGLDSTRAVEVMHILKRLVKEKGTTVMLTIHQPSSALYECFDRLLLLGKGGHTAFFGDVGAAVEHFSKLGHPLPSMWAPSDHYIELLSKENTRECICSAWSAMDQPPGPAPTPRPRDLAQMPPLKYQVRVLLPRQFMRTKRSYLTRIQLKLQLGLALTWGIIYFQVGLGLPKRVDDYVGAVFFVVAHWSWCPLFQGLGNFPKEKEMLTKERASKVYDTLAYFTAQVVAEAPLLLAFPLVFVAIIWPLAALPWQVLPQVFLIICANIQVCSAMSMLISAVCMDQDIGIATAIVVMVAQMCTGGYFADLRHLPWFIGWVRFTSFYYYSFGSILRLMLEVPFGAEIHQKALAKYSFSELGYVWELAVLVGMSVIFRILAFVQLRYSKKLKFS